MKILFLQDTADVIGGVEFVNKTLAQGFLTHGHRAGVYSMRLLGKKENVGLSEQIDTKLISRRVLGRRPSNKLALQYFTQLRMFRFAKQMRDIVSYFTKMRCDYIKMRKEVAAYNPDLIIISYTYMLDVVPKKMLSRVIAHIHTSFQFHKNNRFVYSKLNKYKDKIHKVVWATERTAEMARLDGIGNSIGVFNPIKFHSSQFADVINNKKIIYIGRISPEKQVDLIIKMFDELTHEKDIGDWSLELFGSGEFDEHSTNVLKTNKQIRHKGNTLNPKSELLNASILMLASKYEAFSLAVFEANECGVPAIAFEFGEPTSEAIINGETGVVINRGDINGYKAQLYKLMTHPQLRMEYSINAKEHAKLAGLDKVLDTWESRVLVHFK